MSGFGFFLSAVTQPKFKVPRLKIFIAQHTEPIQARHCAVWWRIECKRRFSHVCYEVQWIVVFLRRWLMINGIWWFFPHNCRGVIVPESFSVEETDRFSSGSVDTSDFLPWSVPHVAFLVLGKFEGFQSYKGWKNSETVVSLLVNPCQEINLLFWWRWFFSLDHTLQLRQLMQVFFCNVARANTKLTISSTISILLAKLNYSQLFT